MTVFEYWWWQILLMLGQYDTRDIPLVPIDEAVRDLLAAYEVEWDEEKQLAPLGEWDGTAS